MRRRPARRRLRRGIPPLSYTARRARATAPAVPGPPDADPAPNHDPRRPVSDSISGPAVREPDTQDAPDGGGPPRSSSTQLKVSPSAISWGIVVFVAASVLGFAALFLYSQDLSASLAGFSRFDPLWALPCLAFASFDWLGGGLRVWLLLRPLKIDVPYWRCVEISGATVGLAYLTPSGAGGGPAHLYGLVRHGASVGRAAASNFASVIVNLTFLSLAGLGAWFFGAPGALEGIRIPGVDIAASTLFQWVASTFGLVAAYVLLFAFNPRPARAAIIKLFGQGKRVRTVLRWLHELHESMLIYGKRGKTWLALAAVAGLFHFGGRFLLGWGVLRGFGIEAGFVEVVILHVLLQFLLYFMPTPGATGIGEILAPALMAPFLPSNLIVAYTAVWRVFLTYLPVVVGGGLLLKWVRDDRQRLAETIAGP